MKNQQRDDPRVAAHRNDLTENRFSGSEGRKEDAMMDRKVRDARKDGPKTEPTPVTARKPKEDSRDDRNPGDIERGTERSGRDFDPNVNQRPR
jgi:hypothetical protein